MAIQVACAFGTETFATDGAAKQDFIEQLGAMDVFALLPMLTGEGRAHHADILREAKRLAEAGKIVLRLDRRRFRTASAEDAYRAVADHSATGKITVEIDH